MSMSHDQDKCIECGASLPNEDPRPEGAIRTPCPHCGSTKRVKSGEVPIAVEVNVTADAKLIIGWQEVDRLLEKAEYAAALLVAAVNVEFILWENLRLLLLCTPQVTPPSNNSDGLKTWNSVNENKRCRAGLGGLIQLAQFFVNTDQLTLSPSLESFGWPLNDTRRGIAHTRGFFRRLTQLEMPDWPETRIRQVLEDAKEFCHGNAP